MVLFEDILENLEANGYTILSIETPSDNPDVRIVTVKDSTGTVSTKKYCIVVTEVTDANGNIIDVTEDCQEIV